MSKEEVAKAIAVTAELTRTELSGVALKTMADDLAEFPERAVLGALARCRRELRGGLTLAAILERMDDGRPGADEAWAQAIEAQDEQQTVVWSDEAREAFAIARPVLASGDKIGARMAFRNAYERLVQQARIERRPPRWSVSLGWCPENRRLALERAAERKLLASETIALLLPPPAQPGALETLLLGALPLPSDLATEMPADVLAHLRELRQVLASRSVDRARRRSAAQAADRAQWAQRQAACAATVEAALRDQRRGAGMRPA